MAAGGERVSSAHRRWEDLNQDALVTIFSKTGVADLIAGVPFVCSSWRDAARDLHCWKNLDFSDWGSIARRLGCRRQDPIDFVDLLDFSITRSHEFVDSVIFPDFADEVDLLYVADRCPELLYFSLKNDIPDEEFSKAISKFEFLKGMAVNECLISYEILRHVYDCCIYFSELRVFTETLDEEMASIICDCLPCLHKLEVMDCTMSRQSILTLLDGLKELEYLDISGYENSGITGVVLEKASRLKVFKWDSKYDQGEFEYCSDCEQDWFVDPCECVLDRKVMEWLATHPWGL